MFRYLVLFGRLHRGMLLRILEGLEYQILQVVVLLLPLGGGYGSLFLLFL